MLSTRKYSDLSDSNNAAPDTKKVIKKTVLNYDILKEVFMKLIDKQEYMLHRNKKLSKHIEKFMASGSQPFRIVLNYFKRIYQVDVYSKYMWVYPPQPGNSTIFNRKRIEIWYEFVFLKSILKGIKLSITNLCITRNFDAIKLNVALPCIFENLIHENLEVVHVSSVLPQKYIHTLCNNSATKDLDVVLKISDLSLIQFKIPKFCFTTDFEYFMEERPQKMCLPWVDELRIWGNFEICDITENSMQSFINCINEILPNIKKFEARFHCETSTWKPVYAKMKEIQPKWLHGFSTALKGGIEFFSNIEQLKFKVFWKYQEEDSEYIVDIGRAIKDIKIHDGLNFEFQLRD